MAQAGFQKRGGIDLGVDVEEYIDSWVLQRARETVNQGGISVRGNKNGVPLQSARG